MPSPTRNDIDEEILEALVAAIARKWGAGGLEPEARDFTQAIQAYAAVRQLAVLKEIRDQLALIEPGEEDTL